MSFKSPTEYNESTFFQAGHLSMDLFGSAYIPRDPGSPSENGFMEPKYSAFRFGDWTPLAHQLRI